MMECVHISDKPVKPAESRSIRGGGLPALIVAVTLSVLSFGEGLRLTGP